MAVNAGMVTSWALAVTVILLATGWKRELLDDVSPLAAASASAALLCAAGFPGLPAEAPQPVALFFACAALRKADGGKRIQALFGAVLAGAVWIWLRHLYAADPVFILRDAQLDGPFAAGGLAAAVTGSFRTQLAAVTAAAVAARWLEPAAIGAWGWLDGFFAALAAARAVTLLARVASALAGRLRPQAGRKAD